MSSFSSIASLRYASLADAVSLNPQPLPPKAVSAMAISVLEKVALNPQPLPPKETGSPLSKLLRSLDEVSLNPQPLPPKSASAIATRVFDKVALNPQPLPPYELKTAAPKKEANRLQEKVNEAERQEIAQDDETKSRLDLYAGMRDAFKKTIDLMKQSRDAFNDLNS